MTSTAPASCPFCDIVAGKTDTKIIRIWPYRAIAFRPLNPVVPDHILVVPTQHVRDALEDPVVTGQTMAAAAQIGRWMGPCNINIITSVGAEATQTVFHLHLHVVPRRAGDGLALPWTGQKT